MNPNILSRSLLLWCSLSSNTNPVERIAQTIWNSACFEFSNRTRALGCWILATIACRKDRVDTKKNDENEPWKEIFVAFGSEQCYIVVVDWYKRTARSDGLVRGDYRNLKPNLAVVTHAASFDMWSSLNRHHHQSQVDWMVGRSYGKIRCLLDEVISNILVGNCRRISGMESAEFHLCFSYAAKKLQKC